MFLYKLIKPYTTLGVKTFFRKIYFHHDYHIPKDKPVLITCNHPTMFLDPVIMACMLKEPIHFMVRGDLFAKPFYRRILEDLNMIAIFRIKEGFSNLKNNYDSMDRVSDLLADNQRVVVFAEGGCEQVKRLRPIQKGTARMAFGAIEKHGDMDIHIVPCAVNYTFRTQVRDTVKYEYGEPIRVLDYKAAYAENPNKAYKAITDEIQVRMRKLIVHIADDNDRVVVDQVQSMMSNNVNAPQFPIKDRDLVPLRYDRLIANNINDLDIKNKNILKEKTADYFATLQRNNLTDYGILHRDTANWKAIFNLIFGFVPMLIGLCLGLPFWNFGKNFSKRKSPYIELFSSLWFGVSFMSFLFFLIAWIIAAFVIKTVVFTTFVVLIPYFCFFYITYQDFYHRYKQALAGKRLNKKVREKLLTTREEILKMVNC